MKLFQQLLVAPAALSLIAPVAVNASEINLTGISNYAPVRSDFNYGADLSDIHPTDWAYQALEEIRNLRGCNASMPRTAMTRIEAAALLNKCIANATKLNSSELRLVDEFASELATIKGSDQALNELAFEAGEFSNTTTLSGFASMVIGSVGEYDTSHSIHGFYGYGLDLSTSFSGEDLLAAGITQGSFSSTSGLGDMDFAESDASLTLSSLFYSFPVGQTTITAGPLLDQDDVVSVTTSAYSDAWKLGGNPYTLPGTTGVGAAASASLGGGFNAAASFIGSSGADSNLGIGTAEGDDIITGMVGYDGEGFGGGLIYTTMGDGSSSTGYSALGGGIYYSGENFTLSATYDTKDDEGSTENVEAWLIGSDISVGPGTLSAAVSNVPDTDANDADETSYEVYYSYPVSDYLTITPGYFFIEGDGTAEDQQGVAVNSSFVF